MSPSILLNRKPRVLILSASSGAGHVRAAQALEKAFRAEGSCEVEHIDALGHVSKLFQRIYDKAYIRMVRHAPDLMGLLYEQTDKPWRHPRERLAMDRLNTQPMIRLLKKIQPDLCVATHFLPAEILAWLIAKKKLQARHAIVVTDYDVHALWLCRTVDRYYVAMQESLEYLANIGVPREKLHVTGIPIDPLFEKSVSVSDARKKLGLTASETGFAFVRGRLWRRAAGAACEGSAGDATAVANSGHRGESGAVEETARRAQQKRRENAVRPDAPDPRGLHNRDGSIHGRRGPTDRQGRWFDDFGSSGA